MNMSLSRYLVLGTITSLFVGACNLPLGRASLEIETATPTVIDVSAPTIEAVLQGSGAPTVEATAATFQLAVYPLETRTGWPDLDLIIDAVLKHDFEALRGLTRYTQVGCTHFEGLGGPPLCQPDEAEGEIVEVVPFLGPGEGSHQRREEYEAWSGPDALGLLAVYAPSESVFSDESFPVGEFAIVFLDSTGISDLTLQVRAGRVIRYDYGAPGTLENKLSNNAAEVLLPLSFNRTTPTPLPWNMFAYDRFSFLYPPTLTLSDGAGEQIWRLGDQIEFFIPAGISWVACFDQALGDCPVKQEDSQVEINGLPARRVKGYIGAVGGYIPQEFLTYIFTLDDEQLVFTVYALPFDTPYQQITQIWPLEGMALELFERMVATVSLKP